MSEFNIELLQRQDISINVKKKIDELNKLVEEYKDLFTVTYRTVEGESLGWTKLEANCTVKI